MVHEDSQRLVRDAGHLAAELVGEPVEELLGEEGHVLPPLAQGRDADVDHVEAVEEVVAEAALPHLEREVAVRGRDDADVDLDLLRSADAEEAPLLEDP